MREVHLIARIMTLAALCTACASHAPKVRCDGHLSAINPVHPVVEKRSSAGEAGTSSSIPSDSQGPREP
jgi:hypothetical protein